MNECSEQSEMRVFVEHYRLFLKKFLNAQSIIDYMPCISSEGKLCRGFIISTFIDNSAS